MTGARARRGLLPRDAVIPAVWYLTATVGVPWLNGGGAPGFAHHVGFVLAATALLVALRLVAAWLARRLLGLPPPRLACSFLPPLAAPGSTGAPRGTATTETP